MTGEERRARDAALAHLLDALATRLCSQVTEAVDFARLDTVEKELVAELERLIGEGKLPPAPDPRAIEVRAAAMIAGALAAAGDARWRRWHDPVDDDCELCRMSSTGPFVASARSPA